MIGDSVNLASRLEGINKVYGTSICISEYTHAKLDDGFLCRKLDLVRVKGKEKPITIFEVMGSIDSGISDEATERARAFDAALTAYFQGDFAGAKAHFDELIRQYPATRRAASRMSNSQPSS